MKSLLLFLTLITTTPALTSVNKATLRSDFAYFNFAGSGERVTVSGGDLVKRIVGSSAVSQSESNFLNESGYTLEYSALPEEYKSGINFGTLDDEVYVEVKPYSYKVGTSTYTYVPHSINVDGTDYAFEINESSKQCIAQAPVDNDSNVTVNYQISFSLEKDKVNQLVNAAYLEGKAANESKIQYEADKAAYDQYIDDLNTYADRLAAYLEYKSKLDNYNEYLAEYERYQDAYNDYLQYLDDVATFEERVAKYNKYIEDLEYYNRNKDANQKEYDAFIEATKYASYQLAAMNILWTGYTTDGMTRVASEMIQGSTVATVLENKDELVTFADAPGYVIDEAYANTNNVRDFLKKYRALKTNSERYRYYYYYYKYIKTNTEMLLRCLDKLYRSGKVASIIADQGKKTQYVLLVSELAYFCNAIDDKPIYNYEGYNKNTGNGSLDKPGAALIDENWKFAGKTYKQWLGNDLLDTTKTGEPKTSSYPDKEVELLVPPEEVEKPEVPVPVVEPLAPEVVPEPGEVVPKPADLVEIDEPTKPEFDEIHLALIDAYDSGALVQRSVNDNVVVTFEENVELDLDEQNNVAIFYDDEYGTPSSPIYYSFYEVGATFDGKLPHKEPDVGDLDVLSYSCEWSLDGVASSDLSTLSTSVRLYPFFIPSDRNQYRIEFVVGDKTVVKYCFHNSNPFYDGVITKNDVNRDGRNYYYEFIGWDKTIVAATQDETYTALFDEFPYYTVTYRVNNKDYIIQEYKYGDLIVRPEQYPDNYYIDDRPYEFSDWNFTFGTARVYEDTIIEAKYEDYYYITFDAGGIEESSWVKKGSKPVYDKIPTKQSTYTEAYTFKGWSKTPGGNVIKDFDAASKNIRYYAVFDAKPIADAGGNSTSVNLNEDTIVVEAKKVSSPTFDISKLIDKFKKNPIKSCVFWVDNASVSFSASNMEMLTNLDATTLKIDKVRDGYNNYTVELIIKNSRGELIKHESLQAIVTMYNLPMADHYLVSNGDVTVATSSQSNQLSFKTKLNTKYKLSIRYNVQVEYFGKATIKADKSIALPGEVITASYTINDGYTFVSAYAKTKNGQIPLDENNQFIMPEEDVVITVIASKNIYHFNYYVGNNLYYHISGNYGDIIEPPTNIYKESDSEYQYVFIGWDSDIRKIEDNVDFYAVFDAIPISKPIETGGGKYSSLLGILIILGSSVLVVGGLIFLVIFLLKKKH